MDSNVEARKKRFASYRYHAARIALFVLAVAAVVSGMLMITVSSGFQTRAQTVSSSVARSEAQANVLLLLSYSERDSLTSLERTGVVDIMNRSGVAVDVEYMDAITYPEGSAVSNEWANALSMKLDSGATYNAIICADDEALAFAEKHHDDMFAGLPVVFFNVNDVERAMLAGNSGYATGIVEQQNISKTIELTKQLNPKATKLMAVVDNTMSGIGDRGQFDSAVAVLGGWNVEYVNASELTRDELASRVASADSETVVFFLDAFNDSTGATYTRDESARFVSNATSLPVYGVATGGVGQGLVGAGFTDPEKDGQRAAETCIKILNGNSLANFTVQTEGSTGFVFDEVAMQAHGINAGSLPDGAVIINQSKFSWDSIRPMLLPGSLLLIGVIFLLAFALLGYRHSLADTQEIIDQSNRMRHRFYHDLLTEKHNMQWLSEYMQGADYDGAVKSIVSVDFVEFSDINDSYGRKAGDAVIVEFAERLDALEKVFLARTMGAEFLIGYDHELEPGCPELQTLIDLINDPVPYEGSLIEVGAYLGVVNATEAPKVQDMVVGVDLAVRNSKALATANEPIFYTEQMLRDMREKIDITACLKQSIKDESFVILYQPQVDARTLEVCGYEALVRLEGNPYYPGQFIPVAEMSGLVIDIDRIVTKKTIAQLAEWRDQGKRLAPVSINYSAVQLRDVDYVDFLVDTLKEYDISPKLLKIEITESLSMGNEEAADTLFNRFHELGIPMALDDFGTGYTSLSRVATLPAHYVKIDRSLVVSCMETGDESMLENLIRLIHGLKKTTIVEGVEDAEQLEVLTRLGGDIIQGYYFSRPLPADEAADFDPHSVISKNA